MASDRYSRADSGSMYSSGTSCPSSVTPAGRCVRRFSNTSRSSCSLIAHPLDQAGGLLDGGVPSLVALNKERDGTNHLAPHLVRELLADQWEHGFEGGGGAALEPCLVAAPIEVPPGVAGVLRLTQRPRPGLYDLLGRDGGHRSTPNAAAMSGRSSSPWKITERYTGMCPGAVVYWPSAS